MSPTAHELTAEIWTVGTNRSGTTFIRKQYTNVAFKTAYNWYLGNKYYGIKYTVLIEISNVLNDCNNYIYVELIYNSRLQLLTNACHQRHHVKGQKFTDRETYIIVREKHFEIKTNLLQHIQGTVFQILHHMRYGFIAICQLFGYIWMG